MRAAALALALTFVPAGAAFGFGIPAHEKITARACDLDGAKLPALAQYKAVLVNGNGWEDKNLFVKWTHYNHFYNPLMPLHTLWRETSDKRVAALWGEVVEAARRGDFHRAYDRVGHLVHHIQDMGSPPHVVPVNHGLTDGFEKRPVDQILATARGLPIADLSGPDAHHGLAVDTLRAVAAGGAQLVTGRLIPWSDFWRAMPGRFGQYGIVGNRFGERVLKWLGIDTQTKPGEFENFLRGRVEAALGYTRAFLRFAAHEIERLRREVVAR